MVRYGQQLQHGEALHRIRYFAVPRRLTLYLLVGRCRLTRRHRQQPYPYHFLIRVVSFAAPV